MKYIRKENNQIIEEWTGQPSTMSTSNFYLLSHEEKLARGWELVPEPTPVEPSLAQTKKEKIMDVKSSASTFIYDKYPLYKQINSSLGVYGAEHTQTMVTLIQSVRAQVAVFEQTVAQATTNDEVNAIEVAYTV